MSQSCPKWTRTTRLHLAFTQSLFVAPEPGYVASGTKKHTAGMLLSSKHLLWPHATHFHWPRAPTAERKSRKIQVDQCGRPMRPEI